MFGKYAKKHIKPADDSYHEVKQLMKTLVIIFVFFFISCLSKGTDNKSADAKRNVTSQSVVSPVDYCKSFSIKYVEDKNSFLLENSIKTEPKSDFLKWISNVFSPSDSRFTAGYDCQFQTKDQNNTVHNISVNLLLTGTLAFAEHTKWEGLQIIPITYVVDEMNGKEGYGVFKYLEDHDS